MCDLIEELLLLLVRKLRINIIKLHTLIQYILWYIML